MFNLLFIINLILELIFRVTYYTHTAIVIVYFNIVMLYAYLIDNIYSYLMVDLYFIFFLV